MNATIRSLSVIHGIEALEPRRLLSSPTTVAGMVISCQITDGADPFGDSGSFTVTLSAHEGNYQLIGDANVGDSTGTFTYAKSGANTGSISLYDSALGFNFSGTYTYGTDISGTYRFDGGGGFQEGSFQVTGNADPAGVLANNILAVSGTFGPDTIGISYKDGTVRLNRNGVVEKFDSRQVDRIEVLAGDGNDSVAIGGLLPGSYLFGDIGEDTLIGGAGSDTLTGGAGRNRMQGGDGNDRINGSSGRDFLYGEGGDDRLYGGAGNDYLDGGGNVDRLWGDDGDDQLLGAGSNDKLYGGGGNDTLNGGKQQDLLWGEAGDDLLQARDGITAEILKGGDGTDTAEPDAGDLLDGIEVQA